MKNLSVVLSILALVGVIVLFSMNMGGKKTDNKNSPAGTAGSESSGRIAYINIDTLEANYEYLKTKTKDFEARKESMSGELQRSQKQFENDYIAAQRKVAAGTMTEAEAQTTSKKLGQMQESLKAREAALTEQLMKEQDEFNKDLKNRLDNFLKDYNKDKGYDYILSYSRDLNIILLANDALDITKDVVKGMNDQYTKEGGTPAKKEEAKKENK